jgi:hypothetical protein
MTESCSAIEQSNSRALEALQDHTGRDVNLVQCCGVEVLFDPDAIADKRIRNTRDPHHVLSTAPRDPPGLVNCALDTTSHSTELI